MSSPDKSSTYHLYILLCKNNKLYTGIAKDPYARFLLHTSGKGAKYTRANKPIKIVHLEEFDSRSEALKRESEIKKMSKQEKENILLYKKDTNMINNMVSWKKGISAYETVQGEHC